jgi:hypothetical protein
VSAEGSDAGGRRTAGIERAYVEDVSFSDRVQKSHANRTIFSLFFLLWYRWR